MTVRLILPVASSLVSCLVLQQACSWGPWCWDMAAISSTSSTDSISSSFCERRELVEAFLLANDTRELTDAFLELADAFLELAEARVETG